MAALDERPPAAMFRICSVTSWDCAAGQVWVTMQGHQNAVVASLVDLAARSIVTSGVMPEELTVTKAIDQEVGPVHDPFRRMKWPVACIN